jgi:hypothetical protein
VTRKKRRRNRQAHRDRPRRKRHAARSAPRAQEEQKGRSRDAEKAPPQLVSARSARGASAAAETEAGNPQASAEREERRALKLEEKLTLEEDDKKRKQ